MSPSVMSEATLMPMRRSRRRGSVRRCQVNSCGLVGKREVRQWQFRLRYVERVVQKADLFGSGAWNFTRFDCSQGCEGRP